MSHKVYPTAAQQLHVIKKMNIYETMRCPKYCHEWRHSLCQDCLMWKNFKATYTVS